MVKYLPDSSCTLYLSTLHHSLQVDSQLRASLPSLAVCRSCMCNICPTKWSSSPAQDLLWKICWNQQHLEVQSPLKILVSVTWQSISRRVTIFLSQVFRKHQPCYACVSQMVCAWKHMAFIVHIQTICPVYRPKACGSWKCWTHHRCSIAYLWTCRKCIWNFYSAWVVKASAISDRGNESLNLKFCRGRKCMSTVHSSSKHSLSQDKKDLTNTDSCVVSRTTV